MPAKTNQGCCRCTRQHPWSKCRWLFAERQQLLRRGGHRAIVFAVENERLTGPVNVVSPQPVTNREFTKTLGRVLRRPTILPMPAFAARLALGEIADELLLASTRILPAALTTAGFQFQHPKLEEALHAVLDQRN